MRRLLLALCLALAPLSGCSVINHFGDFQAGDDAGPRMDGGRDALVLPDGGVDAPGEDAPVDDAPLAEDAPVPVDAPLAVEDASVDASLVDAASADAPLANDANTDAP